MRRLSILGFAFLIAASPAFSQSKPRFNLERSGGAGWPSEEFVGSVCSFYFAPPHGSGGERDTVLVVSSVPKSGVTVCINGKYYDLKWSPKKGKHNKLTEFSMPPGGTWSNGEFTVELNCEESNESDNASYYEGTIELRTHNNKTMRYKVFGRCGC
jgi:hypothetical protein